MAEILVRDSYRNVWRRMQNAMQKNYLKVLTEPITNSDDTYRRLENAGYNVEEIKPIFIYVTKKEKKFEVVDYGEGMDRDELKDNFERYGRDKETHDSSSRALFDQGLSDVLFTRERGGHIYSIKNDEVYHAEFRWKTTKVGKVLDKDRIIRIDDKKIKASREWREKLRIPKGNGTNVFFHFTEAEFPDEKNIVEKLCNYSMLRFINSDTKRDIKVIFFDKNEEICEYPIEFTQIEGEKIDDIERYIKYKNYPKIRIKGSLFRAETDLPQDEAGDGRIGGLLFYDDYKNVYDLTLFGYDGNPHAKKFFGYIEITSEYKLKKSKGFKQIVRNELNQGEALVTDTRDGFVKSTKKSSFYFKLKEIITPLIKKHVEKEIKQESEIHSNLSKKSLEEQKKAFDLLSDLYQRYNKMTPLGADEGKEDKKPENGLEFDRRYSIITKDRKYYIGLRVDTEKIPVESKIYLSRTNDNIKFDPNYFEVKKGNKYGIFKKNIVVKGTLDEFKIKEKGDLIAKYKDKYESKVNITIIEEELYSPKGGFEFHPKDYRSKQGTVNKLHLYIDKEVIPLGETIIFRIAEGEKIRLEEFDRIEFSNEHIVKDNIGLIKIPYIGYKDNINGKIEARWVDKTTSANIMITYQKPKEKGKMFEGWDYKELPTPLETYYNEDTRKIEINASVESNNKYFGKDYSEATYRYEKFLHCQILVAERILDECVTASLHTAYLNGKLPLTDDQKNDPITTLRRMIAEEKRKTAPKIIKHFVKQESINEFGL